MYGLPTIAITATLMVFVTHAWARTTGPLERQAQRFVHLATSLGKARPAEVDAYFGPRDLDDRRRATTPSLSALQDATQELMRDIQQSRGDGRRAQLLERVRSLNGLFTVLQNPQRLEFDREARLIYDIAPGVGDQALAEDVRRQLESLLPGSRSLADRVAAFRQQFVVPTQKRVAVFARALEECRARTTAKWPLPNGEGVTVVWTHDVISAWHGYEGHYRSTLKINPAAVAFLGSAIDVACHEGYPGHHAQFVLEEMSAGQFGLPVEDTIVMLRSRDSMLREAAAEYGVELVFPPDARLAFERDVLFPLAGLDASQAERYVKVNRLIRELGASTVPILRAYRDGHLSIDSASQGLQSSALVSSPAALLKFVDELGPYVLGYTVAPVNLRGYIEASSKASHEDPWSLLRRILEHEDVRAVTNVPGAYD